MITYTYNMKKYINAFIIIITTFFMFMFIFNRELIFDTVSFSLNIWVNNIVPCLFPFFILTDILISYNFVSYLPKGFIKFLSWLFHIRQEAVLVFLLSMISGFPTNARNTRKLYDMKVLNVKEASHLLSFTHFSNPLFILGTVSIFFLNDKRLGIIILVAHYMSNIILGILFRNNGFLYDNSRNVFNNNISFSNTFINAIKTSVDSILLICGVITCFLVISSIFIKFLNLNNFNSMVVKCLLEITIGIKEVCSINLDKRSLAMIISFILSFGGLSVHAQVKAQLIGTDISTRPYLVGRVFQALISIVLSYIVFNLFY